MFELWFGELLEIVDEWEGYKEASSDTLDLFIFLYKGKARANFLDKSVWHKL